MSAWDPPLTGSPALQSGVRSISSRSSADPHPRTCCPRPPRMTDHSPPFQDKEVTGILATAGNVVTLTIIPTVIYEHMIKK